MNGKKLFVDNILESHLYRDGLSLSCNDTIMLAGNFSLNFFWCNVDSNAYKSQQKENDISLASNAEWTFERVNFKSFW